MSVLTKDRETRLLSGVCAGLANYIAIDVTWVRLAFILLALASGLGTAVYLVLTFLIPLPEDADRPTSEVFQNNLRDLGDIIEGMLDDLSERTGGNRFVAVGLITIGVVLLFTQFGYVGYGWVVAAALILMGGYMLYRRNQ